MNAPVRFSYSRGELSASERSREFSYCTKGNVRAIVIGNFGAKHKRKERRKWRSHCHLMAVRIGTIHECTHTHTHSRSWRTESGIEISTDCFFVVGIRANTCFRFSSSSYYLRIKHLGNFSGDLCNWTYTKNYVSNVSDACSRIVRLWRNTLSFRNSLPREFHTHELLWHMLRELLRIFRYAILTIHNTGLVHCLLQQIVIISNVGLNAGKYEDWKSSVKTSSVSELQKKTEQKVCVKRGFESKIWIHLSYYFSNQISLLH